MSMSQHSTANRPYSEIQRTESNENGDRDFTYKIFYQESRSGNANAEPFQIKVKPTSNFFHFKEKIIKEDEDLKDFNVRKMTLYRNEIEFRENKVFKQLGEPVGFEIGSRWKDPFIVLISTRDAKRLRESVIADVIPAPDSELVEEDDHLPFDVSDKRVPFVNRENSTAELLNILYGVFLDNYNEEGISTPDIALIDTGFGTGKSRFAHRFLKCVKRMMDQESLIRQLPDGLKALFLSVKPDDSTKQRLFKFQQEILLARTIPIDLAKHDSVAALDHTIRNRIVDHIQSKWSVNTALFPDSLVDYLKEVVKICPVFLVLDEIGKPFVKEFATKENQRLHFLEFVNTFVAELRKTKGLHILLCGRSPFLNTIAVRPSGVHGKRSPCSPDTFRRVLLNPIREDKIEEMLRKSRWRGESLVTVIEGLGKKFDEYCKDLYSATSGNPRAIINVLKSETKDPWQDVLQGLDIDDIMDFIREFAKEVKVLYDAFLNGNYVNLKDACRADSEKPASKEYIASRLMGGYETNPFETKIFFPPKIVALLDLFLGRLGDFLSHYHDSEVHINKSRVFEFLLLKLFQSVLSMKDPVTFGTAMKGFITPGTKAGDLTFTLDVTRTDLIGRVMKNGTAEPGRQSINFDALGRLIFEHFEDGDIDSLVPGSESNSPDIFLLPHALNNSKTCAKHIIGIAAKCYSHTSVTYEAHIDEEIAKFVPILEEMNSKPKHGRFFGSLLICSTHYGTKVLSNSNAQSEIYTKVPKNLSDCIEVIIVNLGTPQLRRDFFGMGLVGLPVEKLNEYLGIIENIINHRS